MTSDAQEFDLIIVGAGSGNSIPGADFDDQRVAIVERWTFGGTCLNRGCIPSKMFILPAHVAAAARRSAELNVDVSFNGVDWKGLRDRVFGRIDPIAESGRSYRDSLPNVTVFSGSASFVAPKVLSVDGQHITAPNIVLAVGSRPRIPNIPGIDTVPIHTSDTVMRIDQVPESLLVLGGGFVACEMAHVFASFGSRVTIVNRSPRLLMNEDLDVSAAFTESARSWATLYLDAEVDRMNASDGGIVASVTTPGGPVDVACDEVLVAVGRTRNGDQLNLEATGLACDHDGRIDVDAFQRTAVEGIWALGDVSSPYLLKHVANHEARVVAHNIAHPADLRAVRHDAVPHGVFVDPEIASVGLTESAARELHGDVRVVTKPYSDTAYGWGLNDTTSFVKLIGSADGTALLGAHIIGPQATTLLAPLVAAMALSTSLGDLASAVYYPHPALSEVVEQALLDLVGQRTAL